MTHIAKFNPYDMTDEVILEVATGRNEVLKEVLHVLKENLQSKGACQHLMIQGPRGMGKSFFLKYLNIQFRKKDIFENSDFVLLPEEQSNIDSPSDLINMIMGQLNEIKAKEILTSWEETEEQWDRSSKQLKSYCEKRNSECEDFTLVVVLENLNEFLYKIRNDKIAQSRFRMLLERQHNFTLIGASPATKIDSDYNKRLFKAFKEIKLQPWEEADALQYFERRQRIYQQQNNIKLDKNQIQQQRNKLRAISKFTGGSPRMIVVLSDLLLTDDVFSTANTLYGLIDDLTPYYQDLTKNIRPQSRKLFDTLIRAGENKSQSEIAELLGTTQNKISKPFLWLVENGYVYGEKRKNSKSFIYYVRDRIFVLYYHRREIYHNQNYTPVWLLSDFLMSFYQQEELKDKAIGFLMEEPSQEAMDLAKVSLLSFGYQRKIVLGITKSEELLDMIETGKNREVVNRINWFHSIRKINSYERSKEFESELEGLKIQFYKLDDVNDHREFLNGVLILGDHFNSKLGAYKLTCLLMKSLEGIVPESLLDEFNTKFAWLSAFANYKLTNYLESNKTLITLFDKISSIMETEDSILLYQLYGLNLVCMGKFKKSLDVLKKSLAGAIRLNSPLKISAYQGIASSTFLLGQYRESLDASLSASELIANEEDLVQKIAVYALRARIELALGMKDEATVSYKEAIRFSEEHGKEKNVELYLELASLLSSFQEYKESIGYFEIASEYYLELGLVDSYILCELELAFAMLKSGKPERIPKRLRELYGKTQKKDQKEWKFVSILIKTMIDFSTRDYNGAIKKLNKFLEFSLISLGEGVNSKLAIFKAEILIRLKKYKEAIEVYNKLIAHKSHEKDAFKIHGLTGKLGCCYILDDKPKLAWELLKLNDGNLELIFSEFCDAIKLEENDKGTASGFKLAVDLLHGLRDSEIALSKEECLSHFFSKLIMQEVSEDLILDITDEAARLFSGQETMVIVDSIRLIVSHVKGEKNDSLPEDMSPDVKIAVEAILSRVKNETTIEQLLKL